MKMFWMIGVAAFCLGCGLGGSDGQRGADGADGKDVDGGVTLKILDVKGINDLISSHRGRVVVVDFWATTCPPCLEEFPGLVKLHKTYPRDVACISVSTDFYGGKLEDFKPSVLEQLVKFGATFDNVLSSTDTDALLAKLELPSVPSVLVFNRDGKEAKRFTGPVAKPDGGTRPFNYGDVEEVVKTLLKSSAPSP